MSSKENNRYLTKCDCDNLRIMRQDIEIYSGDKITSLGLCNDEQWTDFILRLNPCKEYHDHGSHLEFSLALRDLVAVEELLGKNQDR